jgi:P27 family predicted phage terminase small subunit
VKGRKPQPTVLKILRGNPGKRRLPRGEPRPSVELPDCPGHLDEEARAEWNIITPLLLNLGVLTRIDRAALAAYCLAWSRWIKAEQAIKQTGEVLKSADTGNYYRNPFLDVSNRAMAQMYQFLTEFGMTPASRSKVNAPPTKDALDEFEEFKKRG